MQLIRLISKNKRNKFTYLQATNPIMTKVIVRTAAVMKIVAAEDELSTGIWRSASLTYLTPCQNEKQNNFVVKSSFTLFINDSPPSQQQQKSLTTAARQKKWEDRSIWMTNCSSSAKAVEQTQFHFRYIYIYTPPAIDSILFVVPGYLYRNSRLF